MSRAAAHVLAVSVVLSSFGLPGCGSESPVAPTRALLTQGQVVFPRPEVTPGIQPLYGVVNFTSSARGDLEVTADWGNASNVFTLTLRQGTCGVTNHLDCTRLVSATEGPKPSRLALSDAPAASYSLDVLLAPPTGSPFFFPETVSYQVFLTN